MGPLELPPEGRHWYTIEREASPEPTTFLPTLEALSAWLKHALAAHVVDPGRTVIAGFSQGAVMAYSLGLAAGRPSPAGILVFSGYLPRVDGFDLDLEDRAGLPVSIAHGSFDPTVSVDFGREARARLERAGLAVRYHEDPAGHTVTPGGLAQARAVLAEASPKGPEVSPGRSSSGHVPGDSYGPGQAQVERPAVASSCSCSFSRPGPGLRGRRRRFRWRSSPCRRRRGSLPP